MRKLFLFLSFLLLGICSFAQSRYISKTTKNIVHARDGGRCRCCGSSIDLEYDHIVPFACGGSSHRSNIQLLCQRCNRSKSNSCDCKVHSKKVGIDCCDDRPATARPSATVRASGSRQCTGTTQKGARCRKITTDPSGRCHLH